jgi:hypothetical protein
LEEYDMSLKSFSDWREFEKFAREIMSKYFRIRFEEENHRDLLMRSTDMAFAVITTEV